MTGSILFSIVETRPDIAFITSVASHFAKKLGYQHTKVVKIILQYFKGFRKQEMTCNGQEKLLVKRHSD